MSLFSKNFKNKKGLPALPLIGSRRGFTLVELLVTIGITLVILGTLVFNQSHYSDSAALKNLADTIGLTVRQAQVYGVSVKEFNTGSNNFSSAYGVDFNSATPTSYI